VKAELINGNILEQKVDIIVNSWNRNIIPWWLLLPQGVSGEIKKLLEQSHLKKWLNLVQFH
jgi:O-acetyl-ADP-ribose deacetylase